MVAQFDAHELAIHHAKHQSQFPGINPGEYEALADAFLRRPPAPELRECTRKRGDFLRYNTITEEFGILSGSGVIRTYFRPVPCVTLPPAARVHCHGHPTNLDYFRAECKKERS
jgi:pyocin large subunit-like protein